MTRPLGFYIYEPHFKRLTLTRTPTDGSGYFEGLASTWDLDRDNERFAYGAWAESIAQWQAAGSMPPLFWSHRKDQPDDIIGRVLTMEETIDGLRITAQLDLGNPLAVSIYEKLLAGTLNTMSVGFIGEGRIEPDGVGVITKAELLEVSLTPVPSNTRAVVETVKNKRPDPNDPAVVNRLIDQAADRSKAITDEDRRAVDEFILAEKLAAIQRALDQDEQKRWEQQMATLALNQVPVRVDSRMRPVAS